MSKILTHKIEQARQVLADMIANGAEVEVRQQQEKYLNSLKDQQNRK